MERAGTLHPIVDENGHRAFDSNDLGRVAAQRQRKVARTSSSNDAGELAARAFEMFGRGARLADVVIKLRAEPARVRDWHRDWCSFRRPSDMLLSSKDQGELGAILGEFKTPGELIGAIGTQLKRDDDMLEALYEIADLFDVEMERPRDFARTVRTKLLEANRSAQAPSAAASSTAASAPQAR
jgi:hypothetical protein